MVLGGLATAMLAAVLYVLAVNGVTDRRDRLVRVGQQATAAQTEAARLAPFAQFAQLEAQRVATVQGDKERRPRTRHATVSRSPILYWGTTVIAQRTPGARPSRASAVSREQSRSSARATYEAS